MVRKAVIFSFYACDKSAIYCWMYHKKNFVSEKKFVPQAMRFELYVDNKIHNQKCLSAMNYLFFFFDG